MSRRRPVNLGLAVAVLALLLATFATLAGPATPARAAAPPNPNDPCANAGKDTCGTTGVGKYATYSFGLRWFGDYRGAIKGVSGASFCIDLGFWFPGPNYGYQQRSAAGLKNKNGQAVSDLSLHQMAYAIWQYGRSSVANQQEATMLYVHGLMGDASPGEVAPNVLGPAVNAIYSKISSDATKYAGPYTLTAAMPDTVTAGSKATLRLELKAASGAFVPGVTLTLSGSGGAQVPASVTTNATGDVSVPVTPGGTGSLKVNVTSADLPSNLPVLYVPTSAAAAASGQRLIVPASQTLQANATTKVIPAQLNVSTTATPATVNLGGTSTDAVTIAGAPSDFSAKVTVSMYGPAQSADTLDCSGTPDATTTYTAGPGASTTPALTPTAPGYYGYQLKVPATSETAAITTPCGGGSETFIVMAQPQVATQVSSPTVAPGAQLSDTLTVTGLGGQAATVTANLYGPYASAAAIDCKETPVWTGAVQVNGDGTYHTDPTTLSTSGYYVYQESIAATTFVAAAQTQCSDTAETSIVTGTPTVTTKISATTIAPGAQLSDQAIVSGLGKLTATVNVDLWGPYPTKAAIDCQGTPAWTGSFTANGDGTYTTDKTTVPQAGYYVYQESIAATPAYPAVMTDCSAAPETTFARATPNVTTLASAAVVEPGSAIHDQLHVTGLGKTKATVVVDLFGPYASIAQITCGGKPLSQKSLPVPGDGTYSSPATTVPKAGFYVFRERIAPSPTDAGVQTQCADVAETTLGAPMIITGPGERIFRGHAASAVGTPAAQVPKTIQIPSLGVSAPVDPATIDLSLGQLGVPSDIHRTGWWRDGAAPGAAKGTVLIAGHVDSATAGGGAFFPLKSAAHGALVSVTTGSGRTYQYRVVSVQTVLKAKLPSSIFTRTGPPKLVLVTCGGPFDEQTKHYVDNVIVTATPA